MLDELAVAPTVGRNDRLAQRHIFHKRVGDTFAVQPGVGGQHADRKDIGDALDVLPAAEKPDARMECPGKHGPEPFEIDPVSDGDKCHVVPRR